MPQRPVLAVSTGPLWRSPIEQSFAAIRAAGGEAVEVMVTQDTGTQSAATLERLAQRYDLPIVAVHAPQLLLTRRVFTTDPLEKIRRTLEITRALDVRTIVLHPPYVWQLRYGLWIVHELQDAIAGSGTAITMENMYPVAFGRRKVGFQRFQGLDNLLRFSHVTLDTSHCAVAGEDLLQSYAALRDRVVHVHLSDNRGKGRDSHAPPGEGVLPLAEFMESLDPARVASVALEINPGAAAADRGRLEAVIGQSVDFARRHMPSGADRPGPAAQGAQGPG